MTQEQIEAVEEVIEGLRQDYTVAKLQERLTHPDHRELIEGWYERIKHAADAIEALLAEREELRSIVKRLAEWDKKYPKRRVHSFDSEKEHDAICEAAHAAIDAAMKGDAQ